MAIRGLQRIRRGVNYLLNQVRGRAAILLYHRIADHVPDPQLLCVKPAFFKEHLELIRRHYHVMCFGDLLSAIRSKSIPRRAVVITLDDGYVDNLWQGKPILEQYDCPATVFVASGFIGALRELLSDELERILLFTPHLPDSLKIRVQGKTYQWELGRVGRQDMAWNITDEKYPSPRHLCYHDLHRLLTPLAHSDRDAALTELFQWSGNEPVARADRMIMNSSELKQLTTGGLVEVGAHTVHHLVLGRQPASQQRAEILGSRTMLEAELGRQVTAFAYPYGDPASIGEESPSMAAEAGFLAACANSPGLVSEDSLLFSLPRFMVRNWPGNEFAGRLARFFCC